MPACIPRRPSSAPTFRVADAIVRRHFRGDGNTRELARDLRDFVSFRHLNLVDDPYPSLTTGTWGMDLILCRNVLIYFDREMVELVQRRLLDSLAVGGYLLLGASDPMIRDDERCESIVTDAGLVYRRVAAGTRARRHPTGAGRTSVRAKPRPATPEPSSPSTARDSMPEPAGRPQPALTTLSPASRSVTSSEELASLEAAYAARDYGLVIELAPLVGLVDDTAPRAAVLAVRAMANLGDLAAAGRTCAGAIERHRESAELLYLHSLLLAEAGHAVESARAARSALYLDRGLVVAHIGLGNALLMAGSPGRARGAFRNAGALLEALEPGAVVPASDGEPAASLAEMVRIRLMALEVSE